MLIEVLVDPGRLRRWQADLVARIEARAGMPVAVRHVRSEAPPMPTGLAVLFALERLVFRISGPRLADAIAAGDCPERRTGEPPALTIDCAGVSHADVGKAPVLRLSCGGGAVEAGAVAAVLSREPPVLSVERVEAGRREARSWRVAVERPEATLLALDAVFSRLVGLVEDAVFEPRLPGAFSGAHAGAPMAGAASPARAFVRALSEKITRRLDGLLGRAPRWSVAWRPRQPDGPDLPDLAAAPFRRIPEDGSRFYADPFLWSDGGRQFLFVEEFPFSTGKGILSVAEMTAGGPGAFRPVLDLDCHLSYPFLFRRGGETFMIPETSGRRTVEFWAATDFPRRFEKRHVIENIDLADATLVEQDETLFLFGTSRYGEGDRAGTASASSGPSGSRGPGCRSGSGTARCSSTAAGPGRRAASSGPAGAWFGRCRTAAAATGRVSGSPRSRD